MMKKIKNNQKKMIQLLIKFKKKKIMNKSLKKKEGNLK